MIQSLFLTRLYRRTSLKRLATFTIVVLLGMLLVGLHPRDCFSPNNVTWLKDQYGLRFQKNGIAYTGFIDEPIRANLENPQEFSVEIAFKADNVAEDGFRFLFMLHAGDDGGQLLFAQWRSTLIVMNADDYSNRRRVGRLTAKVAPVAPHDVKFVTVTSGPEGSRVYCNGHLIDEKRQLHLEIPRPRNLRLLIGNSLYGRNPWQGVVYGLALYNRVISVTEAEDNFKQFSQTQQFAGPTSLRPFLRYRFDERSGTMAYDDTTGRYPLQISSRMKVLSPRFFFHNSHHLHLGMQKLLDKDVLMNFFGFVPLGILLAATLAKMGGRTANFAVVLSLAGSFCISLFIETVQAWMPARSSDLRDLILNSCGALAGALCFRLLIRRAANSPNPTGL